MLAFKWSVQSLGHRFKPSQPWWNLFLDRLTFSYPIFSLNFQYCAISCTHLPTPPMTKSSLSNTTTLWCRLGVGRQVSCSHLSDHVLNFHTLMFQSPFPIWYSPPIIQIFWPENKKVRVCLNWVKSVFILFPPNYVLLFGLSSCGKECSS